MFFDQVPEGRPDAVFGLTAAFRRDDRPHKVDLTVGIYKNAGLEAELFPAVREAKERVLLDDLLADYLPMDGLPALSSHLGALVFGASAWEAACDRIYGAEAIGGTGALRVGAELLKQEVGSQICVPDPSWPNHKQIFERAGFSVKSYPYYNRAQRAFDCDAACAHLAQLPAKTVILFHASCHNPTGCDPTIEEWRRLSEVCQRQKLFPLFDCAYQGLGDGLEQDAQGVRYFLGQGQEMGLAYSCSKNFSLYCQRVGALFFVGETAAIKHRMGSQVRQIIRALYSNPPAHGARIVTHVLQHPPVRQRWGKELEEARKRIVSMREALVARLHHESFRYLLKSRGLFAYVDLTASQVKRLIAERAIYLLDDGRINVAGLTHENIPYVADALLAVSKT